MSRATASGGTSTRNSAASSTDSSEGGASPREGGGGSNRPDGSNRKDYRKQEKRRGNSRRGGRRRRKKKNPEGATEGSGGGAPAAGVVASGLDFVYPPENVGLLESLAGAGATWEEIATTLKGDGGALVVRDALLNVNLANELVASLQQLPMVGAGPCTEFRYGPIDMVG